MTSRQRRGQKEDMISGEQFIDHLRRALNSLYEPDQLRRSPLVAIFRIGDRRDAFAALQHILTDAIESFEILPGEPAESRAWEVRDLLLYRFVHQMPQRQVATQLGMSVRHLRRKEHAALEVLAVRLWEQFDLETGFGVAVPQPAAAEGEDGDIPDVNDELAWLRSTAVGRPVDLGQVLSEVLTLAETHAMLHGVEVHQEPLRNLPALAVHEVALSQALLNILTVAIHRAAGGRLLISARSVEQQVAVTIEAQGMTEKPALVSADDSANLELTRHITALIDGAINISDSTHDFRVTLLFPASQQVPVLVIDDNADTLQLLQRYATDTRYRLITLRDPAQALDLAQATSPQAILLDVMMPQIDGWKLLAQLRQHPRTEFIPVIVCTILAQEELALSLGARGFVRKPINRSDFLAALERALGSRDTTPC